MSAEAMPIPTHIKLSPIKNAHIISTAKGKRNCVIAKITVLLKGLPPVTEVTNFDSKRNCIKPVTSPISKPIIIFSIKHEPPNANHYSTPNMYKNQHNLIKHIKGTVE